MKNFILNFVTKLGVKFFMSAAPGIGPALKKFDSLRDALIEHIIECDANGWEPDAVALKRYGHLVDRKRGVRIDK